LERREEFLAGAAILGKWPETHALPGGLGLVARRQRRDSGSAWLLNSVMVLGCCYSFSWN